jgi:Glycosyl transferases group 1
LSFDISLVMACGTPVLAFRCGSVPEIIEDGVTGMIVETIDEAVAALPAVMALDRKEVRQRFEQRFTATRMAKDYVDVYRLLLHSAKYCLTLCRTSSPAPIVRLPTSTLGSGPRDCA